MSDEEKTPIVSEIDPEEEKQLQNRNPLLDRLLETDHDRAVEKIEAMTRVLDQLRLASIRATYPSDWLINVGLDADGNVIREVGYLQDCGAERGGKVWGIEIGQPAVEREDFHNDQPPTFAYHMMAQAHSKVTGESMTVEGSRWSGDRFFAARLKSEGDRVDPVDVRKAAYANLHGRAVRALGGLNAVPLETLRAAGVDVSKVVHVSYGKGTSRAAVGTSEAVIPWGNAKGKKLSELDDKDLAYYAAAFEKNVNDPERSKYKASNEKMLAALKAEQEKRTKTKDSQEQGVAPKPADQATHAQHMTNLRGALREAFGAQHLKLVGGWLSARYGRKIETVAELSEQEAAELLALTRTELAELARDCIRDAEA